MSVKPQSKEKTLIIEKNIRKNKKKTLIIIIINFLLIKKMTIKIYCSNNNNNNNNSHEKIQREFEKFQSQPSKNIYIPKVENLKTTTSSFNHNNNDNSIPWFTPENLIMVLLFNIDENNQNIFDLVGIIKGFDEIEFFYFILSNKTGDDNQINLYISTNASIFIPFVFCIFNITDAGDEIQSGLFDYGITIYHPININASFKRIEESYNENQPNKISIIQNPTLDKGKIDEIIGRVVPKKVNGTDKYIKIVRDYVDLLSNGFFLIQ